MKITQKGQLSFFILSTYVTFASTAGSLLQESNSVLTIKKILGKIIHTT